MLPTASLRSCFMNSYKFRGTRDCKTTIMTEHLLSLKTFCLGKRIQWLHGKGRAKLARTETERPLRFLYFGLFSKTPQKNVYVIKIGDIFYFGIKS